VAGVLGSDGAAATRVRWAIAGLSFRFAAALLRVVASLADDGVVRFATPFPCASVRLGDMIVGAVLLVAAISPSALAWISFAGSADAAALTLAASASWRLTPETASFAESASSVVEATCGGEEVTLGPKDPVVIAGTSGGTSGTMGVEFRPGAEASEVTRSSCKRRRSEELSSCHAAVLPITGTSTWVVLIGLAAKFLITVGESFGWSVAVEVETLTGISSGTPRLISGISVARTCVATASTPEAIPVAEAPGDVGARPAASKSPARKRVTPQKVPITQAAPRPICIRLKAALSAIRRARPVDFAASKEWALSGVIGGPVG